MLTDLDCIAIREAKKFLEAHPGSSPILHLEDLVIDVSNMVAYWRNSPYAYIQFKVFATANNERTRSRLSSRKPFDVATVTDAASTSFFAKELAEFGATWGLKCSGENDKLALPSAR